MSFILAVLCFYYGTNNIISAFSVSLSNFEMINWLLLLTGLALVIFGIACTFQAVKDYKEKQNPQNNISENDENIINEDDIIADSNEFDDEN